MSSSTNCVSICSVEVKLSTKFHMMWSVMDIPRFCSLQRGNVCWVGHHPPLCMMLAMAADFLWHFLTSFFTTPPNSLLDNTLTNSVGHLLVQSPSSMSHTQYLVHDNFTGQTESTSSTRELMATAPTPFAFTPSNCLRNLSFL